MQSEVNIEEAVKAIRESCGQILGEDRMDKISDEEIRTYVSYDDNYNKTMDEVIHASGILALFIDNLADLAMVLFDKYGHLVDNPKKFFNEILAAGLGALSTADTIATSARLSGTVGPISPELYTALKGLLSVTVPEIREMLEHDSIGKYFQAATSELMELQEARDAKARKGQ